MTSPGIRRNFTQKRIPAPIAGANWELSPGGQRWWRLVSMVARLVTSAVVANRRVRITATEGGNAYFVAEAHLAQPASTTMDYAAHNGSPVTAADSLVLPLPLPSGGLLLRPGALLVASVTNLDAGDQWSAIVALVEEVPSGLPYQGDQLIPPIETLGG